MSTIISENPKNVFKKAISLQDHFLYNQKCKLVLQLPEVRFVGLLDPMGNQIAGGFREGVTPLKNEEERRKMNLEAVLRIRTRQEFDYYLGPVKYAAARREKVVMMTFLVGNNVLLVSAEPDVDIDKTAQKIIKMGSI